MSDELMKKDIRNLKKMDKQVTQEKQPQAKEKSFKELWKEGKQKEKREKREGIQQARKEKIERLTTRRDELLHERKQTLEIEKSKADIRKLRSESSAFYKLKRIQQKIKAKQKARVTQPATKLTTKVSRITDVGRYKLVMVDGKPMSFDTNTGKLRNAKAGKQQKKKEESFL